MPIATDQEIVPRCRDWYCTNESHRRIEPDFDADGFDSEGYDREGFGRDGFSMNGLDRDGFGRDGYNGMGRDREGYNRDGFTRYGQHRNGTRYNDDGYDRYGYDRDGYDRDGYNDDGRDSEGCYRYPCSECNSHYCGGCEPEDDEDVLHGYSYTPSLQFMGDSGPWYGMEIEVTVDALRDAVGVVSRFCDNLLPRGGDLVYCKHDSSVDGMEMVTHPMSYDWAMANFPWDMLPALRSECGADVIPSDNGIHVHVGRDAFNGSAHLYRWLKLWYRNPADIQRIARRNSTHWGSFRPEHRAAHKEHVKFGKPGYDRDDDATLNRYSAINTTNANTLEVRVFASSLRPQRVKAALQLVAASVEYTRQLSPEAIAKRHGWDWRAFMSWVADDGRYPDLVIENRLRRR